MKPRTSRTTLELALTASGCDKAPVIHKPRLLSDNGPSSPANWRKQDMIHVGGAPKAP